MTAIYQYKILLTAPSVMNGCARLAIFLRDEERFAKKIFPRFTISFLHSLISGICNASVSVINRRKSSQPEVMDVTRPWSVLVSISVASFKFLRSSVRVEAVTATNAQLI